MKYIIGIVLLMAILVCGCSSQKVQPIPSVIAKFDSNIQPYLETIPINTDSSVRTSMAMTCLNVKPNKVRILVNPTFLTFSQDFQSELLTHEYLNIIGAEKVNLDQFDNELQKWYNDPAYGEPTNSSNYFKYILWFSLYREKGIKESALNEKIDQFAFVGETLERIIPEHRSELPDNIQAYYKGILK